MAEESKARLVLSSNIIITAIIALLTASTGYMVGTVRENTEQNFRITALENDNRAIHELLRDQIIGVKRFDDFQRIVLQNQAELKDELNDLRNENNYIHGRRRVQP